MRMKSFSNGHANNKLQVPLLAR